MRLRRFAEQTDRGNEVPEVRIRSVQAKHRRRACTRERCFVRTERFAEQTDRGDEVPEVRIRSVQAEHQGVQIKHRCYEIEESRS